MDAHTVAGACQDRHHGVLLDQPEELTELREHAAVGAESGLGVAAPAQRLERHLFRRLPRSCAEAFDTAPFI